MHYDATIVILAHNGRRYTSHCLDSLLAASTPPRQVIVVNNGSTDDTAELIAAMQPRFEAAGIAFLTWRNDENKGCSTARNEAWARATSRYVVFMDNDAAVCTRDWLARLVAIMDADPKLALLGPKMIYPYKPHRIQCAGVAIDPRGRIRFRGRGAARDDAEHAVATDVPALISATWIMRRDLLETIGGLDDLFHPVQYEDLDLCLRATDAGYRCAYTPEVEMYHFEGSTTASLGDGVYRRTIVQNSAKFRQRWKDKIRQFPPDPADYRWLQLDDLGLTPDLDLTLR